MIELYFNKIKDVGVVTNYCQSFVDTSQAILILIQKRW